MTAIRYAAILFFSLIALSIQTAHATKGAQFKVIGLGMDLSHTLTSSLSVSTSVRRTNPLQQLTAQERIMGKNVGDASYNSQYVATLQLDHNSSNVHGKLMENDSPQQQAWLTIKHDHELISNIPIPATDMLLDQSRQLLAILDVKQATMRQVVQDAAFDTKDTLISIIMPGGLLYASHRKLSHIQAKERLTQVVSERDELAMDILMLQSVSGSMTLAMAN